MGVRINPRLGDSVEWTRLPQQKFQVTYWYENESGRQQFSFVLPDDFLALTDPQQDELLFEFAQLYARITGAHS